MALYRVLGKQFLQVQLDLKDSHTKKPQESIDKTQAPHT